MPPPLRGEMVAHYLAPHGSKPAPYRLGDSEHEAYASGVLVVLQGDPDDRRWRRIEIVGRGLQGRWRPFDWAPLPSTS